MARQSRSQVFYLVDPDYLLKVLIFTAEATDKVIADGLRQKNSITMNTVYDLHNTV